MRDFRLTLTPHSPNYRQIHVLYKLTTASMPSQTLLSLSWGIRRLNANRIASYSYPYLTATPTLRTRTLSTLPNIPLFRALQNHDPTSQAVIHSASSRSFTYGNLLADVLAAKEKLRIKSGSGSLAGERVAFLAENSYDYVGISPYTTS